MFGGVDPGPVDEADPVRAVAARRLAGMGVDATAAAAWLARYGTDWVHAADAGGRRLSVLEEQGIHAEVTFPGPVLCGGISPAMYLGGAHRQGSRRGVARAPRLQPVVGRVLRGGPGPAGGRPPARPARHGPRRAGDRLGTRPRPLRRDHAARNVDPQRPAGLRRCLLRAAVARLRGARHGGQPAHRGAGTATDAAKLYDDQHGGFLGLYEVFVFTRRPLWFLILGGVFDRHPELRVAVTENGVQWLPSLVADLEAFFDTHGGAPVRSYLRLRPSEYVARHVSLGASLMQRAEAERRREIGVGRIMWGADYPHLEGRPRGTARCCARSSAACPRRTCDRARTERGPGLRVRRGGAAPGGRPGRTDGGRPGRPAGPWIPPTFSWSLARPVPLRSASHDPGP